MKRNRRKAGGMRRRRFERVIDGALCVCAIVGIITLGYIIALRVIENEASEKQSEAARVIYSPEPEEVKAPEPYVNPYHVKKAESVAVRMPDSYTEREASDTENETKNDGEAEDVELVPEDAELPPCIKEAPMRYVGQFSVYGYDTCAACCGKSDGITASGATATVGRTIASNDFPFGTVLYIDGIGERVVEDVGGMPSGALDVLCEDHPACYAITGIYDVYVVEAAEK